MAERTEARRRRADGRQQRRSSDAQPAADRDQATGSAQSQAFAAARKAAGTAAAAALAGALAGGLKALVDRRQRSPDEDAPTQEQPEEEHEVQEEPKSASEPEEEPVRDEQATRDGDRQPDEPQHGASSDDVGKMIESARSHLRDLLGEEPESVSGISSSNGTWTVALELVEVRRIPETTDVLASYEVVLDDDGDLVRLERRRRYFRSQVEEGP